MTGEATDLLALKRLARDAGGKVCWTAVETGRPEFRNVSHYIYDGPTMLAETNGDLPHIAAFMAATAPATILSLAALIEAQAAEIEGLRKAVEEAVTAAMWSEKALERYDNALGLDVDEAALIALSKCKDFVERYDTHRTTQEGPKP